MSSYSLEAANEERKREKLKLEAVKAQIESADLIKDIYASQQSVLKNQQDTFKMIDKSNEIQQAVNRKQLRTNYIILLVSSLALLFGILSFFLQ